MSLYSIIFHVNEVDRCPVALGNLRNLLKDVGQESIIAEVIVNGPAVVFFSSAAQAREKFPSFWSEEFYQKLVQDMKDLHEMGVCFTVCSTALSLNGLHDDQVYSFVTLVPAGITEIVKKQSEGYGYVKP